MPKLVDDPEQIIRHFSPADIFLPEDTEQKLTYEYSPDLFSDDENGFLFKDYVVTFIMSDIQLSFKWTRNGFSLIQTLFSETNKGNVETPIESGIQFKDITFMEKGIKVKDHIFEPIIRVTLEEIDD